MRAVSIAGRSLIWISISIITLWESRTELSSRRATLVRAGVARLEGKVYRTVGRHKATLDVYLPANESGSSGAAKRPAVVAIHGGSWCGGTRSDYASGPNNTAIRLIQHGLVVIAVDYRLARPGSPSWPAVIDDVREAVRWTRRHASELNIDPDRIVALGQSAGGHLAAMLGTLADQTNDDGVSCRVQAVVSFYGPSDLVRLTMSRHLTHDPVQILLGNEDTRTSRSELDPSPIHHVTHDDAPMLLLHGSDDTWVPPDQSLHMAKALDLAGVSHRLIVVAGARHGFEATVNEPTKRDLLPEILAFLESVWNVSTGTARPDLKSSLSQPGVP
jgi:acetyl esterase/lipase